MTKEITIEKLDKRKIRKRDAEIDANKLLYDKKPVINGSYDLSRYLFDNAPMVYLNPTEELLMGEIIDASAPCALILGSGDFAIDAIFHGAKHILTFDINRYQFYPASLKFKALQNMNYDEYWNFFSNPSSSKFLSPELYTKLKRRAINDSTLFAFYDVIMNKRKSELKVLEKHINKYPILKERFELNRNNEKNSGIYTSVDTFSETAFDRKLSLGDPTYTPSKVIRAHQGMAGTIVKNSYLENQKAFNLVKDMIKNANIKFIRSDVSKLRNSLEKVNYLNSSFNGFKTIYLSNVPEYLSGSEFLDTVENQLMPLLSKGGYIVYCCQGVSSKTLNTNQKELDNLKNAIQENSGLVNMFYGINPFIAYQQVNDIEGFNLLLENKYEMDLVEKQNYSFGNGIDNSDTFVYIKKK